MLNLTDFPLSKAQQRVLNTLDANPGVYLSLTMLPGTVYEFSDERINKEWLAAHNERPVSAATVRALVALGRLKERREERRIVYERLQ